MKHITILLVTILLATSCGKIKKTIHTLTADDEKTVDTVYVNNDTENLTELTDETTHHSRPQRINSDIRRLPVTNANYNWSLSAQGGNTYNASNLFDGKQSTAWAVKLSTAPFDCDALYGPTFDIEATRIDYIMFTNGYAKSAKSFNDNSRAKYVIIARADYDVEDDSPDTDRKILYSGPIADTSSPQRLKVQAGYRHIPGRERYQIIFLSDFTHGTKYDDLCISEIEFYGR